MKLIILGYAALLSLFPLISPSQADQDGISIGFLALKPLDAIDSEAGAAYRWLASEPTRKTDYLQFQQLKSEPGRLAPIQVLWWHYSDDSTFSGLPNDPQVKKTLLDFLANGGKLLLTLNALPYLYELGLEPVRPETRWIEMKDEGYGRQRGFHSFRGHPIFSGLFGGAFIWNPVLDQSCKQIGYFDAKFPQQGRIIAVDRAYITISESARLVLAYPVGKGQILAIGAYTYLQPENMNRPHLELFLKNCLNYLAGSFSSAEISYWHPEPATVTSGGNSNLSQQFPPAKTWQLGQPALQIGPTPASQNYWDLAGARLFLIGQESGGIEEVWAHPFIAMRDFKTGIQTADHDSIRWLDQFPARVIIRPEALIRSFTLDQGELTEVITISMDSPIALVHYEYLGPKPIQLTVQFYSNLRRMWPFSEQTNGSMQYSTIPGLQAVAIQNSDQDFYCLFGANAPWTNHTIGQFKDFKRDNGQFQGIPTELIQVGAVLQYRLSQHQPLDLVLAASNQNFEAARQAYDQVLDQPAEILARSQNYFHQVLQQNVMITTPDQNFNQGYRWAVVGTDRFLAHTPGLGQALLAGYGTSNSGWRGGHAISGRPGYAWYFGRDAVWSALAMTDYGDFAKVKTQLEFFQQYQDITGKIFHELTTSGVVHYDAADATPLYILLAGHYLRFSGDLKFIQQSWPALKKAIDFCYATDTDGDYLIENTNVGHGWVEGGSLYGAHTTLYLASVWSEALKQAAYLARHLNLDSLAHAYLKDSDRVREIVNAAFYNATTRFYHYGKLRDGSFNPEPTVLATIPLYFHFASDQRAQFMLDQFAGNEFSADWGVRIVSAKSPKFNPRGYHYGSVWPLFTGWAALAEYRYGNHLQGFAHAMANLNVYRNWAQGYVEEVLHGALYQPSGVCRHQCWSETMVLQPILEGMLGLKADAMIDQFTLAPRLPADWDSLRVSNLRVGAHELDFRFKREKGLSHFNFIHRGPGPLQLRFLPAFPLQTRFKKILVNGQAVRGTIKPERQYTALDLILTLNANARVDVQHSGGIAVLPLVASPQPGDSSRGFRIISAFWSENGYEIQVQGQAEHQEILSVYCPEQNLGKITEGRLLSKDGAIYRIQVDFAQAPKYQKVVTINLK